MRGSRVLVTGGAGMIGSTVVDQLLDRDVAEIVVVDNFERGLKANLDSALESGKVTLVEGDICDRDAVQQVVVGVDVVFHLAALRITQCVAEPRRAVEVLVNGTFNVLEAAVNAEVRRVVAASSASVYGLAEAFPTVETHHPYGNRTLYGAAKAFNEGLLRSFNEMYGLQYVALRYFNVYGPRMDVHSAYTEVLIRWMNDIDSGRSPLIIGDGTQTMDFVFVDDAARASVLAAESEVSDEVFNVGSGTETSLNELAIAVLAAMGSDLQPQYTSERPTNPVTRRLADTSRARSLLGYRANMGLDQGLRQLVEWWRSQRGNRVGE